MVLEHVILPVIAGKEKEFEAAFEKARPIITSQKGLVDLTLRKCLEEPNKYLMLINWETLEDHTVGFRQGSDYNEWKMQLHHFYDPHPTVLHFEDL